MARLCPHRIGEKVDFATADDPNALWPSTTWTQDTSGTFPMASSPKHALGSSGGSETHTLTVDEMPSHKHDKIYISFSSTDTREMGYENKSSKGGAYPSLGLNSGHHWFTSETGGGVVSQHPQPVQGRQPLGARGLKRLGEVA